MSPTWQEVEAAKAAAAATDLEVSAVTQTLPPGYIKGFDLTIDGDTGALTIDAGFADVNGVFVRRNDTHIVLDEDYGTGVLELASMRYYIYITKEAQYWIDVVAPEYSTLTFGNYHPEFVYRYVAEFYMDADKKISVANSLEKNPGQILVVASSTYKGLEYDRICDGTRDEVEINAAITYLSETYGGGIVELTEGTFYTAATITPRANIVLQGRGWSSIIEKNFDDILLKVEGTAGNEVNNIIIKNLQLSRDSSDTNAKRYFYFDYCDNLKIDNVYFKSCYHTSIYIRNSEGMVVNNCYIYDSYTYGINLYDVSGIIKNCLIDGATVARTRERRGISIVGTINSEIIIRDNIIKNFTSSVGNAFGIYAHAVRTTVIGNTIINITSTVDDKYSVGIFSNYGNAQIINNYIDDCDNSGGSDWGRGIECTSTSDDGQIVNNYVVNCSGTGISIDADADRILVTSNFCRANGSDAGITNENEHNFYDLGTDTMTTGNSWQEHTGNADNNGQRVMNGTVDEHGDPAFLIEHEVGDVMLEAKPLTDNLIGYWPCDEGTGLTVYDKSENDNDGTFEGTTPAWTDGKKGKAISLAGVNERVDCGNGAPLDNIGSGSFWLSIWMKSKDAVPLNYGYLWSKEAAGESLVLCSHGTNNKAYLQIIKGGVTVAGVFSASSTIFDGNWNHVVLVINRTTDKALLYKNKVQDATEIDLSTLPDDISNATNVSWGGRHDGVGPYEGALDELRIYTGVPTEADIAKLNRLTNPEHALLAFANGFDGDSAVNFTKQITTDATPDAWKNLLGLTRHFLYADYSAGAVTYGKTLVPPTYSRHFHATHRFSGHSLLHFEEVTTPLDEYTNSGSPDGDITWTASGAARSAVQKKWGTYSYLFDGANDYIETTDITDLQRPFTMEIQMYSTSDTQAQHLFGHKASYGFAVAYQADVAGDYIRCSASNDGASWDIINNVYGSITVTKDAWHKITFEWDGSFYRCYIDGVLGMEVASTVPIEVLEGIQVGNFNSGAADAFLGYLDEWRCTIGNCRYGTAHAVETAAFSPDTQWFDTQAMKWYEGKPGDWTEKKRLILGEADADRRVGALLHLNGTDGDTDWTKLIDEYGNKWTFAGTARLEEDDGTNTPKFGSTFLWLDGNSDYIVTTNFKSFGTGSWCAEGWWHTRDNTQDSQVIFSSTDDTHGMILQYDAANGSELYLSSDGANWDIANADQVAWTPTDNTWYHIAIEFDGSNYKVYIDGVLFNNIADSTVLCTVTHFSLGARSSAGWANWLNGGIDEFRLTIGHVQHGAAFTPAIAEFATEGTIDTCVSKMLRNTMDSTHGTPGFLTMIPEKERAIGWDVSINPTTTWTSIDLSKICPPGVKAIYGYAQITYADAEAILCTRCSCSEETSVERTRQLQGKSHVGDIIGMPMMFSALHGKFDIREFDASTEMSLFNFRLHGWYRR